MPSGKRLRTRLLQARSFTATEACPACHPTSLVGLVDMIRADDRAQRPLMWAMSVVALAAGAHCGARLGS